MDRSAEPKSAASRAQWLAELAAAIDEAQRLVWALGALAGSSDETRELNARIEAARLEVESLRRGRLPSPRDRNEPFWTSLQPWSGPVI